MKRQLLVDRAYMHRCLELAARGRVWVSPNPMVGCVIVRNGKVVGEGFHERFGGSHAEANALREAGRRARGSTVYVNLEPCSHYGKTPPCVHALLRAGVKRVVASTRDPNPMISGQGFARLRRAGVKVEVGVLKAEAERLNERFYTFMRTGIPFVGIKIAQTLDGYIADDRGHSKWITSENARREAHRIRAEYDAIVVGAETVINDNPKLTVRMAAGRNPVRVVLDPQLRCPARSNVLNTKLARTIVIGSQRAFRVKRRKVLELVERNVQVLGVEARPDFDLRSVLQTLGALGISSVLVEGGRRTTSGFLKARLARELHCFVAPSILGGGLHSFTLDPGLPLAKSIRVEPVTLRICGADVLVEGPIQYR